MGLNYLGSLGKGSLPALVGPFLHWVSLVLMKAGTGISLPFERMGHDMATNTLVEARTVLDYGVSSLVGGMADEAVAKALDS